MSLFRIDPDKPVNGPHQEPKPHRHGASVGRAKAAMIMIHGRGATAKSMFPLADELAQPDFHYIAPQAQHHTWYPHSFLEPKEKNQEGIQSGMQVINDLVESLSNAGIPNENIILLGFSQGACLAQEYIARHPQKLGGIVGLSGGLIGQQVNPEHYKGTLENTPIFIGCGENDQHVPVERIHLTASVMEQLNGAVNKQIYPNMGHTVNEDEIKTIRAMMAKILSNL
jgi:phospholipase/carboxylesterase